MLMRYHSYFLIPAASSFAVRLNLPVNETLSSSSAISSASLNKLHPPYQYVISVSLHISF